jgi:predicted outer membrane protein
MDAMLHRTILSLTIAASPLMMMQASDSISLSARDNAFIHQIMNYCTTEIRTAEAALKRHLTDSEAEFARQVINNHLNSQRVLEMIAKNKNVPTRDEVQADEQGRIVTASIMRDKDFNAFFLRGEIRSVSTEIALYEVELRDGTDEDLKLFASTYLPSLKKSLIIAKEFDSKY